VFLTLWLIGETRGPARGSALGSTKMNLSFGGCMWVIFIKKY